MYESFFEKFPGNTTQTPETKTNLELLINRLHELKEQWREIINQFNQEYYPKNPPEDPKKMVHALILWWIKTGAGEWKETLVRIIRENEKATQEAQLIQMITTEYLRRTRGENITAYRGVTNWKILQKIENYANSNDTQTLKDPNLIIQPWTSLTENIQVAIDFACGIFPDVWIYGIEGVNHAVIIEVSVPVENIFVHYLIHPAFELFPREKELILNHKGGSGMKVKRIIMLAPDSREETRTVIFE